jgi:hypothetical protein
MHSNKGRTTQHVSPTHWAVVAWGKEIAHAKLVETGHRLYSF